MSVSGFKDKFLFYGFLPKKEKELDKVLFNLSTYSFSQVFFIPSLKINYYLKKFKNFFSGRKLVIAREMTKIHETFYRGDVDNFTLSQNSLKGEITAIISEKTLEKKIDKSKIVDKAKKYLKKYSLKDTVNLIIETEELNKKEVYNLCLKIKNEKVR